MIIDNTKDHGGGEYTEYNRLELSGANLPLVGDPGRPTVTTDGYAAIDITTNDSIAVITDEANAFDIVTSGDEAHGIEFQDNIVNATVTTRLVHYGNITTTGHKSRGVQLVQSGGTDGSTQRIIDIILHGDITTTGAGNSRGINIDLDYAQLSLTHVGNISTISGQAIRVRAFDAVGPVTISQTGVITSAGRGFDIEGTNVAGDIAVSSGDVTAGLIGLRITGTNVAGDITVSS